MGSITKTTENFEKQGNIFSKSFEIFNLVYQQMPTTTSRDKEKLAAHAKKVLT